MTGGVKRYGDFDPHFANIEMRDWTGGRGGEYLSDDPTKYFDGYGWSLTPGYWHQAPQWWWGEFNGPSTAASTVPATFAADNYMPGALRGQTNYSLLWRSLATTQHVARSFLQQGSSYIMTNVETWVRKIGEPPAPLNVRILSSASTGGGNGRPASSITVNSTIQLASSSVEPLESFVWAATVTSASTQSGTTTLNWWVELWTSVAGTDANHWEVAYDPTTGPLSTANVGTGTSGAWTTVNATTLNIYFRVSPTKVDRNFLFFKHQNALYAYNANAAHTSGFIWLNGDRGLASTESTATPNTTAILRDPQKVWRPNMWVNATVAIVSGTGRGQKALITASSVADITANFPDGAPSSDSQYVIYDTNEWTQVSTVVVSSLSQFDPTDIVNANNIAYIAYGNWPTTTTAALEARRIGSFRWATSLHQAFTETTVGAAGALPVANKLQVFYEGTTGMKVFRARGSDASVDSAPTTTFGTTLTWGSTIIVGSTESDFTNLIDYNGAMYAFKEDSLWRLTSIGTKVDIGLEAFPSSNNGAAIATQNLFLYFGWSNSVERFYGSTAGTIDDIGPWKGSGLKSAHRGPYSVLMPYIAWMLGGVDAGTSGISGMYAWNDRGWHEFYRAHRTGARLQGAIMQTNPGAHPRLWMSVGGELICQRWPKDTLNPRNDGEVRYQHEAVLESGIIDMNSMQIPKLFSKVYAVSRNLESTKATIYLDYQLDDDIGSTLWTPLRNFRRSPIDGLDVRRGNKRSIRLRLRGVTYNSTAQSELQALTLNALGRIPVRRQWNISAAAGDFQVDLQGLEDSDPDEFYKWIRRASVSAEPLLLRSAWEAMDDIYVYIEQPIVNRLYTTPAGEWGANLNVTIREMLVD
jgi:hypothetical protein